MPRISLRNKGLDFDLDEIIASDPRPAGTARTPQQLTDWLRSRTQQEAEELLDWLDDLDPRRSDADAWNLSVADVIREHLEMGMEGGDL